MNMGSRFTAGALLTALVLLGLAELNGEQSERPVLCTATARPMYRSLEDVQQSDRMVSWFAKLLPDSEDASSWLSYVGVDEERLRALRIVKESHKLEGELEDRLQHTVGRCEQKMAIATRLLEGEISLKEAAQQFADMDRELPQALRNMIQASLPGRTELERYCHRVLSEVEKLAEENQERSGPILKKLHAELGALAP